MTNPYGWFILLDYFKIIFVSWETTDLQKPYYSQFKGPPIDGVLTLTQNTCDLKIEFVIDVFLIGMAGHALLKNINKKAKSASHLLNIPKREINSSFFSLGHNLYALCEHSYFISKVIRATIYMNFKRTVPLRQMHFEISRCLVNFMLHCRIQSNLD